MRHLVFVCLHEGRPGRSAVDVVTTSGIVRQPVEPIYKAHYVRHENVGDGKALGEPFTSRQYRLHMLEPVNLKKPVQKLPGRCIVALSRECQYGPGQARRLDRVQRPNSYSWRRCDRTGRRASAVAQLAEVRQIAPLSKIDRSPSVSQGACPKG